MKLQSTPIPQNTLTPHPPPEIAGTDLRQAVSGLSKVISRRATLPVLHCVRVELIEPPAPVSRTRRLRLTATDLDLTLRLDVPVLVPLTPPPVRPVPYPPFLIPLERLRNLAKSVRPQESVVLGPVRGAPPLEEWPPAAESNAKVFAASTPVPLPDEVVTGMLRAFACASHDHTRQVLQSAYLDVTGGGPQGHRVIGTDGRHLFSSNSFRLAELTHSVVLPDHPIWSWKPLHESRPWTLTMGEPVKEGPPAFRIEGPFWSVTGQSLEGQYPNYRQVIPRDDEFKTRIDLPAAAVRDLARLIPVLPGGKLPNRPVGLEIRGPGAVALLFRDTHEEPWEARPIAGARATGPAVTVFAGRDYLARAFGFGLDRVDLIDPLGPIRLSRGGDLMIVMPLRMPGQPDVNRPATPFRPIGAGPVPDPGRSRESKPNGRAHPQTQTKPQNKPQPTKPMAPTPPPHPAPKPHPQPQPSQPTNGHPIPDPLEVAEARIAEARQALDGARQGLVSVATALKLARQQRRQTDREVQAVRSTLRTLQKAGF